MRWALRLYIGVLCLSLISGCSGTPIEPTIQPRITATRLPSPTSKPEITLPVPTLPPTWTPDPRKTEPATATLLPSITPTTTIAPLMATNTGHGVTSLKITEEQLNAALARRYGRTPLPDFAAAPHVTLGDQSLAVIMRIVPYQAPPGSSAQTMTLTVSLAIQAGALEIQPTQLAPLEVGVLTRQVKPGQALLLQALTDLVGQAAGNPPALTYNYVDVRPDGITLTVVAG